MPAKERSEDLLLHLNAAYNLARWLMKNEQDARDVVQDAFIRCFRSHSSVENVKTWFLTAVRNTAFTALKKSVPMNLGESAHDYAEENALDPEQRALQRAGLDQVRAALRLLSEEHREVFVLREIEDLSYDEIAEVLAVPVGTVMSRLARARTKLSEALCRTDPGLGRGSRDG